MRDKASIQQQDLCIIQLPQISNIFSPTKWFNHCENTPLPTQAAMIYLFPNS